LRDASFFVLLRHFLLDTLFPDENFSFLFNFQFGSLFFQLSRQRNLPVCEDYPLRTHLFRIFFLLRLFLLHDFCNFGPRRIFAFLRLNIALPREPFDLDVSPFPEIDMVPFLLEYTPPDTLAARRYLGSEFFSLRFSRSFFFSLGRPSRLAFPSESSFVSCLSLRFLFIFHSGFLL